MNIGNYFRLSPDNRLNLRRARPLCRDVGTSAPTQRAAAILRASLAQIFPHLAHVEIDYCWGGLVDMTKDAIPRGLCRRRVVCDGAIRAMARSSRRISG